MAATLTFEPQPTLPWKYQSIVVQYFREQEYFAGLDLFLAFISSKTYLPPRNLLLTIIVDLVWQTDDSHLMNKAVQALFHLLDQCDASSFRACFFPSTERLLDAVEEDTERLQPGSRASIRLFGKQSTPCANANLIESDFWNLLGHCTKSIEHEYHNGTPDKIKISKFRHIFEFFGTVILRDFRHRNDEEERTSCKSTKTILEALLYPPFLFKHRLSCLFSPVRHGYAIEIHDLIAQIAVAMFSVRIGYQRHSIMVHIDLALGSPLSLIGRLSFYKYMPPPLSFDFSFHALYPSIFSHPVTQGTFLQLAETCRSLIQNMHSGKSRSSSAAELRISTLAHLVVLKRALQRSVLDLKFKELFSGEAFMNELLENMNAIHAAFDQTRDQEWSSLMILSSTILSLVSILNQ